MKKRLQTTKRGIGHILAEVFIYLLTFVLMLFAVVYILCGMASSEKRPHVRSTFVTTMLETGALKFVVNFHLSADEIAEIVDLNSMGELHGEVDENLITVVTEHITETNVGGVVSQTTVIGTEEVPVDPDGDGIDIFEVYGKTFYGTMMIVYDPQRLSVSAKYPWVKTGDTLDKFVKNSGAVAGINGGLYNESGNLGGTPLGVVVSNGDILRNEPSEKKGLVMIGLTEEGILRVDDLKGLSKEDTEKLIREKKIRNAVCFQEETSDKNNHFVQLMINGEKREMNGMGSGLNPRTAIGQRADGALLLLVTDGRGASGHLGASASDLIEIMAEYGAVNAANLDGGSSSCMYYDGGYLMNSVTFYYANSSWNMPLALVIK